MDNFFNYITKPISPEDVDKWFRGNNIIPEKIELYFDFSQSLYKLMTETYLGYDNSHNETKIALSENDNDNHFEWCWNKAIDNFKKENIRFNKKGDHYDYFKSFFDDSFYGVNKSQLRLSIPNFLDDIFNMDKEFVKPDLDILTEYYKILQKHVN